MNDDPDKIVQLCPVNNLYAVYEQVGKTDKCKLFTDPVLCLALSADGDIQAVMCDGRRFHTEDGNTANFVRFRAGGATEASDDKTT